MRTCSLRRRAYSRSRRLLGTVLLWMFLDRAIALPSLLRHPRAGLSTLGFSTTAPPEQTARFSMPTSTPTVGAILDRRQWLSCLHREAGKPAACGAVTVTSLMRRPNLRCSTMATRPTLGIMTVLPSTFTVSGPLSARKPCSCFRRLKRGNPRLESRWFDRHRRNQILCQRAGRPAFGDCGHLIISPASSC